MHAYTADFISFSYNTQYYIYILSRPAHIHIFVIYSVRIVLRQSRSITACIYRLLWRASMPKCYSLRLLLTHSYVSSTYIILFESLNTQYFASRSSITIPYRQATQYLQPAQPAQDIQSLLSPQNTSPSTAASSRTRTRIGSSYSTCRLMRIDSCRWIASQLQMDIQHADR